MLRAYPLAVSGVQGLPGSPGSPAASRARTPETNGPRRHVPSSDVPCWVPRDPRNARTPLYRRGSGVPRPGFEPHSDRGQVSRRRLSPRPALTQRGPRLTVTARTVRTASRREGGYGTCASNRRGLVSCCHPMGVGPSNRRPATPTRIAAAVNATNSTAAARCSDPLPHALLEHGLTMTRTPDNDNPRAYQLPITSPTITAGRQTASTATTPSRPTAAPNPAATTQ
jgi:hypothetical protein